MKYMLFAFSNYYPIGGVEDLGAIKDSYDECYQMVENLKKSSEQIQIAHIEGDQMVLDLYLYQNSWGEWEVIEPSNLYGQLKINYAPAD